MLFFSCLMFIQLLRFYVDCLVRTSRRSVVGGSDWPVPRGIYSLAIRQDNVYGEPRDHCRCTTHRYCTRDSWRTLPYAYSRSFGSVVLAATYRGLCKACLLKSRKSSLVGCPLLLQLWSYERFPIGRPYVYIDKPFGLEDLAGTHVPAIGDLPTMGSVWTRREVLLY